MRLTKSQVQSTDLQEARATFVLSSKSPFHAPTMIYLLGLGGRLRVLVAGVQLTRRPVARRSACEHRVPLPLMCGRGAPARAAAVSAVCALPARLVGLRR